MKLIKTKYTIGIAFNKTQESYISFCVCNPFHIRILFGNERLFLRVWIFELSLDPAYEDKTVYADDPWSKRKGPPWKKSIIDVCWDFKKRLVKDLI